MLALFAGNIMMRRRYGLNTGLNCVYYRIGNGT